jgi:hypothetical protein
MPTGLDDWFGKTRLKIDMFAYPVLSDSANGWGLSIHGAELNMTKYHDIFQTAPTKFPVYEGEMIYQFTHALSKPRYWLEELNIRKSFLVRRVKKINGLKNTPEDLKNDYEEYRIVIRRTTRNQDSRTLISTIIPPYSIVGNSLAVNAPFYHDINSYNSTRLSYQEIVCLDSFLNSFVVDSILRSRISKNLNISHLNDLPIPRVSKADRPFQKIVDRAAKLICTTPEFDDLAAKVGLGSHTNGITDEVQRAQLRAELDGIIAHLYHLTETEFAHILQTFPIVPEATKIMALNAYRDVERGLI